MILIFLSLFDFNFKVRSVWFLVKFVKLIKLYSKKFIANVKKQDSNDCFMKINLIKEKGGYFSSRKQEKTQSQLRAKINESATRLHKSSNSLEEILNRQKQLAINLKPHPLQIPTQRYFKRVYNKPISSRRSPITSVICSESPKQPQSFILSSNSPQLQVAPHSHPNQSTNHPLTLLSFHSQQSDTTSCPRFSTPRKSKDRPLNFNKIFIESQEQNYRQVIQLSVRELENKEMLQKAVHELDKRKFKKKVKLLEKKCGGGSIKSRTDLTVEELRSHRIGYKTFYRREILTERLSRRRGCQNGGQFHEKENDQGVQVGVQSDIYRLKEQNSVIRQIPEIQSENDHIHYDPDSNIIIENQTSFTIRHRQESQVFKIQQSQRQRDRQISESSINLQSKVHERENTDKEQRQKSVSFQLPSLQQARDHQRQSKEIAVESRSKTRQRATTQQFPSKSPTHHTKPPPTITRSQQSHSFHLKTPSHMKLLQHLANPNQQPQSIQPNHSQPQQQEQLQLPTQIKRIDSQNEQFPFLLTKEDLQMTLNKSRFQVKKMLCMHIQKRKKQWNRIRRKALISEDSNMLGVLREDEESMKGEGEDQKAQQNEEGQVQEEEANERRGDVIQKQKGRAYQSQGKLPALPPKHLLNLRTRDLKKSMRSFVSMINKDTLSPKQRQVFKVKFN